MALLDPAYVPLAHHHVVGGDHDDLDDNVVYIQPSVLHCTVTVTENSVETGSLPEGNPL